MTQFNPTRSNRYPDTLPPPNSPLSLADAIGPEPHRRPTPPVVIELLTGSLPRFQVGRLMVTAAAAASIAADEALQALRRHAAGDWGLVGAEDWAANDLALREGTRLLSSYETRDKTVFWIITEADRSVTTILLPSDY